MTAAPEPRRRPALPETALGLGTLAFAALVLWQAWEIPVSPLYAKIGPSIFPFFTGGALAVLAVLMLAQALRGGWQNEEEKAIPIDRKAVVYVLCGLVANVALIGSFGFTIASTALFVLVARGFGSRAFVRDAAIGFAVALLSYFGFAKALGVTIGAGLVERLLGG
ncbi:MAG TPA: tripartite tricarboxylate transporter TctB family protein [Xanthobacteraceae bacterium]|nr:tripartite tricarboxylate transporter TctB family protein [Xanthobacteraceae bacterium]